MHLGPRIIDIAPFDGSDRREFIDGPGEDMLSRDKRYCTQQNIDEIVSRCGEMPLGSVWVNYMNRFAHLGFTDDQCSFWSSISAGRQSSGRTASRICTAHDGAEADD